MFNTRDGKYRSDRIKNIGEAPRLLDSSLVDISSREIQKFLAYKSFFNAAVTSEIRVKNKKAYITFIAEPGPSFKVRNINHAISDSAVRDLYVKNRENFTKLHSGNRYDVDSIMYEINSIFTLMKSNGYYDFLKPYIHVDADSTLLSSQVDLKLNVYNPLGKMAHKVYYLKNTNIDIRNSNIRFGRRPPDSAIVDSQYFFRDYSHRFKFDKLTRYIFLNKGKKYSVENENLTYDRLYELNVFRNIKIEYEKDPDSIHLNARMEITPLKRNSNRVEGEYTFNSGRNGFNIGNTYTNRNLFGGAERLDIKFRYGILFDSRDKKLFSSIFNRDIQVGANLIIPRIVAPFHVRENYRAGLPHTTISSSMQIFDQPGAFRNRLFINSISYDWTQSKNRLHSFTPINIEYRDGRLDPDFRYRLDTAGNLLYIRTNDRRFINIGSQYNFTLNASKLSSYTNFTYLRAFFDIGGNSLGLAAKLFSLHKNSDGERTFMGLPYLQYGKTEIDLRWYRSFAGERQFVARINPGVAVPYGNSRSLPFERNFYAGGSSGVRAWQARTLGPGTYNRSVIESEETRKNLTYLDQYGEVKVEGNLEYRFKIMENFFGSKLRGATFFDFGNVWLLDENEKVPGGKLQLDKFFDQLALGAGAGLRFDLQYFVFRFDVGAKIKDPQFSGSDNWVIKHLFSSEARKEFKEEYIKTNSPDRYRFLQYNFGIGMPF
ncbi:outer membrane protein assembly factor BamA [Arcticibacter pallidicorallinus]|uniref:Outer membrane protein assembly factor BamA n=2 Tax=Arcticibacter pallidicorallinus TaxID=1259464 RepID=A0A2T0U3A5_9SPHI|nr:outer membrane protein assembly factor BamA [Arcticibacter pallidicorallinus]